ELNKYKAHTSTLEVLSLDECNVLESELKLSLAAVTKRKEYIINHELQNQTEQRLCVVCVERDKSVVLLPCRHMCLCEVCSNYSTMVACPLCRKSIVHRISVFS